MNKTLFFFFMMITSSNLFASQDYFHSSTNSDLFIIRGVEIRYIKDHPADESFIVIDDKKYPVFNTKKEAISYVEGMSIKRDLTIVYVRTVSEKETEFTDIIE